MRLNGGAIDEQTESEADRGVAKQRVFRLRKSAIEHVSPNQIDRRQLVACREPRDLCRVNENKRIAQDVDRLGTLLARRVEGCLELIRRARLDDYQLHSQQSPEFGELRLLSPVHWVRGIDQHGDPRSLR